MVKGQVCAIKTMMDGDVRLTINVPNEVVPPDVINWRFEDVVIVTQADMANLQSLRDKLSNGMDHGL